MKNGTMLGRCRPWVKQFSPRNLSLQSRTYPKRSEYIKEAVRQGSGLDEERNLSTEAMERGWECLGAFCRTIGGLQTQ
jgi:exopolyphosphatase / guanosine-5'-triphosphate,3'-diphosphate pyrophosphatase